MNTDHRRSVIMNTETTDGQLVMNTETTDGQLVMNTETTDGQLVMNPIVWTRLYAIFLFQFLFVINLSLSIWCMTDVEKNWCKADLT